MLIIRKVKSDLKLVLIKFCFKQSSHLYECHILKLSLLILATFANSSAPEIIFEIKDIWFLLPNC